MDRYTPPAKGCALTLLHTLKTPRTPPGRRCRTTSGRCSVYAGFLEHTDHHVGRLLDALAELGVLDDTLVYMIIGDNGGLRRGGRAGMLQRADQPQRRRGAADHGLHDLPDRRLRYAGRLQPLRGRLGARDEHPLPVDQAGRLTLGRHPHRHDRALAERHRGRGRGPPPVPPRGALRRHRSPQQSRVGAGVRVLVACPQRGSLSAVR